MCKNRAHRRFRKSRAPNESGPRRMVRPRWKRRKYADQKPDGTSGAASTINPPDAEIDFAGAPGGRSGIRVPAASASVCSGKVTRGGSAHGAFSNGDNEYRAGHLQALSRGATMSDLDPKILKVLQRTLPTKADQLAFHEALEKYFRERSIPMRIVWFKKVGWQMLFSRFT